MPLLIIRSSSAKKCLSKFPPIQSCAKIKQYMIKQQIFGFILRWATASLGMWLCITWFGRMNTTEVSQFTGTSLFILAGLIFSVINSVVKPFIKLMALPLAIVTLGISTIVINTAMVALTIYLLPGVEMGIWGMVATSAIMSTLNGLISVII